MIKLNLVASPIDAYYMHMCQYVYRRISFRSWNIIHIGWTSLCLFLLYSKHAFNDHVPFPGHAHCATASVCSKTIKRNLGFVPRNNKWGGYSSLRSLHKVHQKTPLKWRWEIAAAVANNGIKWCGRVQSDWMNFNVCDWEVEYG